MIILPEHCRGVCRNGTGICPCPLECNREHDERRDDLDPARGILFALAVSLVALGSLLGWVLGRM
jgi:hypothetical protein